MISMVIWVIYKKNKIMRSPWYCSDSADIEHIERYINRVLFLDVCMMYLSMYYNQCHKTKKRGLERII